MKKHGNTTHGRTNTKEYNTWQRMKQRCYSINSPKFKSYGGRGIYVCDRWRTSFENFFADMGKAPSPEYSIERIDNNGPYSPENCKWITMYDQAANTRKTRWITYDGMTMCLTAWARRIGMTRVCLQARIDNGWPVQMALTMPVTPSNRLNGVLITYNGKTKHLAEWAREYGLNKSMLSKRLKRGMSIHDAFNRPSYRGRFLTVSW